MNNDTASIVLPPIEGKITVTEVTAGTAEEITIANAGPQRYHTIAIDDGAGVESGCYMIARRRDPDGAVTSPNLTSTSGANQAMWMSAAALSAVVFQSGDRVSVTVPGSGTYYVRQYPSSP